MEIKKAMLISALSGIIALGSNAIMVDTASAKEVKGKVTKTAREGRVIIIGGDKFGISGSRSEVVIGGKGDQDRADIKVGMSCTAVVANRRGKMEARKIYCAASAIDICVLPGGCGTDECKIHPNCN